MSVPRRRSSERQLDTAESNLPAAARALQTPLRFIKGIEPKRAEQLAGFGLRSVEDLLYQLPFRYEDRRNVKKISEAVVSQNESFSGTVLAAQKKYNPRRRTQLMTAQLADPSGIIGLIWFRARAY